MRNIKSLENGWIFVKNAANAQEAAQAKGVPVTLPHTWNAKDGQDGGNDYHRGTCWYVSFSYTHLDVYKRQAWV